MSTTCFREMFLFVAKGALHKVLYYEGSTLNDKNNNSKKSGAVGSEQSLSPASIFVPNFFSFLIIRQKIKMLFYSGNYIQD